MLTRLHTLQFRQLSERVGDNTIPQNFTRRSSTMHECILKIDWSLISGWCHVRQVLVQIKFYQSRYDLATNPSNLTLCALHRDVRRWVVGGSRQKTLNLIFLLSDKLFDRIRLALTKTWYTQYLSQLSSESVVRIS